MLAKRMDRSLDSLAKRLSARWFYRVIDWLSEIDVPEDVGDFRLMDRRVLGGFERLAGEPPLYETAVRSGRFSNCHRPIREAGTH
ncbi:MAG: hypothetical protein RML32_07615 [Gammaproteobacteria bacterium]|nr:hypothetical protein [Gammaproteobacteria bacterium]